MLETYQKQNPMENPHRQDQTEYAFDQSETYMGMNKFSKMLIQLQDLNNANFSYLSMTK